MNKQTIAELFEHLQAQDPHPTTELLYNNPFELMIAVMLSAQSTDVGVNKATRILFPIANTPQAILNMGEDTLKTYISTLGLYNSKAKHVIQTCRMLVDQFAGNVPRTRKDLESLPGVGRKTANVLLNILYNEPTIAVDTHIFRVGNRTGMATGNTPLEVEKKLLKCVPKAFLLHAHHWLILHGRYTCTARKPHCGDCVIYNECEWSNKA